MEGNSENNLESGRFNPEMLVLARGKRGLSQSGLARELKWTQSKLSKVEGGLINLKDGDVQDISNALQINEKLLFSRESRQGFGSACDVFHRKRNTTPTRAVNQLRDQLNFRRIQIKQLIANLEIESDFSFPTLDIDEFEDAEQIAQLVRATWQIPHGPIPNLVHIVESAGGVVLEHEMPHSRIDAVSQFPRDEFDGPIVLLNRTIPVDRWRLTLAHEIGHLVMHRLPTPDLETEANRFAAELLMPADEISAELSDLSLKSAAQLKLKWRVSMQALIYRAKQLEVITESRYKSLFVQMSRLGYRKREPVELTPETPQALKALLKFYTAELNYSDEQIADTMLTTVDDFRDNFTKKTRLRLLK